MGIYYSYINVRDLSALTKVKACLLQHQRPAWRFCQAWAVSIAGYLHPSSHSFDFHLALRSGYLLLASYALRRTWAAVSHYT